MNKADVLAALFNAAWGQGIAGWVCSNDPFTMDRYEAEKMLQQKTWFDSIRGRPIKVDFSTYLIDVTLYNRENGYKVGQRVIEDLRETGDIGNTKPRPLTWFGRVRRFFDKITS